VGWEDGGVFIGIFMVPDLPTSSNFGCRIPHVTLLRGAHSWCVWEEGREIHTIGVEVDFENSSMGFFSIDICIGSFTSTYSFENAVMHAG
jgi:hypothetical protein